MTLHVLQHVPFEGPAYIAEWARNRGYDLSATRFYVDDPLPDLTQVDGLAIMGGPMNIYEEDQYPWLASEKAFVRAAIDQKIPTVGVCLGAQLIADVLGSRVVPVGQKEIGWFPLTLTDEGRVHPMMADVPASFPVFHWHGETFALPEGAVHLARSAACEQQVFLWKQYVLGLQCHLEMTASSIESILDGCASELEAAQGQPWVQDAIALRQRSHDGIRQCHALLGRLLDQVILQ